MTDSVQTFWTRCCVTTVAAQEHTEREIRQTEAAVLRQGTTAKTINNTTVTTAAAQEQTQHKLQQIEPDYYK